MHIDFADAGMIIGLIGLAAALFFGLPMKRKLDRLDRIIAEKEAAGREQERAARPSA
ncbi:MAG TPA: hypothetical protein VF138_01050 [Caulobacteraceae bacterium]